MGFEKLRKSGEKVEKEEQVQQVTSLLRCETVGLIIPCLWPVFCNSILQKYVVCDRKTWSDLLCSRPLVKLVEEWKIVEVIAPSSPDSQQNVHHVVGSRDEAYETHDEKCRPGQVLQRNSFSNNASHEKCCAKNNCKMITLVNTPAEATTVVYKLRPDHIWGSGTDSYLSEKFIHKESFWKITWDKHMPQVTEMWDRNISSWSIKSSSRQA